MANVPISKMQVPGSEDVLLLRDSTAANKVQSPTNGNLASLDANGNLADSGISGDMTTTSASGNPISIANLKSAQIAKNPVITFEPIQAGSGTPSPSNVRAISGYDKIEVLSCGHNLWDEIWELGELNASGQNASSTSKIRSKNYIPIVGGQTYYLKLSSASAQVFLCFYDVNKTFISSSTPYQGTFTAPANAKYCRFNCPTTYGTTYNNDMGINYPATDTSYYSYHKTTDLSESLGQTVYGGTYDPRTGKLINRLKALDMSTMNWQYSSGLQIFYCYVSDIAQSNPMWCSCYNPSVQPITENYTITSRYGYYVENPAIVLKDTRYTDATSLKNALTGQTVVYAIVESARTTIQLTPHEIALSSGYNYVSTNGSQIQLAYHNGELATHADVEQLAETVNELGDKIKVVKISGTMPSNGQSTTIAYPLGFNIDNTILIREEVWADNVWSNMYGADIGIQTALHQTGVVLVTRKVSFAGLPFRVFISRYQ